MKVMKLPNWPPEAGGSFDPRKHKFPTGSDGVLIEEITSVNGDHVTFTCTFEGERHTYDFFAPDSKLAQELAGILKDHVGKTLSSVNTACLER
jgi:hypothetical protein